MSTSSPTDVEAAGLEGIPYEFDLIHTDNGVGSDFIQSSVMESYYPTAFTPSTKNPISWFLRGTEYMFDFSQHYVYAKGEVVGTTNVKVGEGPELKTAKDDDDFGICQNFWHSLFSSCNVEINDTAVSMETGNYPYIAFLQNATNWSSDQIATLGVCSGWAKTPANRKALMLSGTNEIAGTFQLKCPLFTRKKNLYTFMNVKITLNRVTNPEFFLKWNNTTCPNGYNFVLKEIILYVRKQKAKDSYTHFMETILESGKFIRYHYKDCRVFTKTYAGFGNELIEDDIFHGILPSFAVFGFVENDSFSGSRVADPFLFKTVNNSIQEVGLFVNGLPYPRPPIRTEFATKDTYEAYFVLMTAFQGVENPDPPMISKADFDGGALTLFAFNLAVDQNSISVSAFNQPASVRLQVKFKQSSTTTSYTLVVFFELNAMMAFNKTRQVLFHAK